MSEKGNLNFYKNRQLISAIIIIIIVIILDIIFENYSSKSIEKVNGNIVKIHNILNEGNDDYDLNKLEKMSNKSVKNWENEERVLTCFIEHEEVEKISVKLNLLSNEIKNENWADAKNTTSEILKLVEYLDTKYKLNLQNIF